MSRMHAYTKSGAAPAFEAVTRETVVPTVFIGLGGSGKEVLMWLRKRFYDRDERNPGHVRFLFIDTDAKTPQPDGMGKEDFADVKPRQDEMIPCAIDEHRFNDTFARVSAGVKAAQFPWLEPRMKDIGPKAVQDGVGTHRQFGRMALYLYDKAVYTAIRSRIEDVLSFASQHPQNVDPRAIEVVVVTSLAGGTGSGMFLDVAYMVQSVLRPLTLHSKYETIVAFLPSVFSRGDQTALMPRMQQNAYAALLEMEYYGTPREGDDVLLGRDGYPAGDAEARPTEAEVGFPTPWHPDPRVRTISGSAWGDCYLVDNVNDLQPNLPLERGEIFQMTADYLFLDFENHEFAKRKRSMRSNLVQFKEQLFDTDVESRTVPPGERMANSQVLYATQTGCKYSAFGLAQIEFDLDRLYLAAGYRLAWQLVRERWIGRADRSPDETYQAWSQNDLLGADDAATAAKPSLRRLTLIRQFLARKDSNWIDEALGEVDAHKAADPVEGLAGLEQTIAQHAERLGKKDDAIQKTVEDRYREFRGSSDVLGPLRERVRGLVFGHLSRDGVARTLRLLEYYRRKLDEIRRRLAATSADDPGAALALERLRDATRVGWLGRKIALQVEYPRAHAAVREEVTVRHQRVTLANAEKLLSSLDEYIGFANQEVPAELKRKHGTLYGFCTQVRTFLDQVSSQLGARFEQISRPEDQKVLRRQSLSAGWDAETYERQINSALLGHGEIESSARDPNRFDWERLEALVVRRLAEAEPGARAGRLSDYLEYWVGNRQNSDGYTYVTERLADICERIVREGGLDLQDVAGGNAVDLLWEKRTVEERNEMVEQMVRSSAPYLPIANHPQISDHTLAMSNLFGYKSGDHAANVPGLNNAANLKNLVQSKIEANTTEPHNADQEIAAAETANGSTLVLVRELAGFPLLFYGGLAQLKNAYQETKPAPTKETGQSHIDRRLASFDLPDITNLEISDQMNIRDNIGMVFRGMILGWISWKEGQFQIDLTDRHGSRYRQPLGLQLHRMIRYACNDRTIREQLKEYWTRWEDKSTTEYRACVYASAKMTYNIARDEAIRRSARMQKAHIESTPLRNCFSQLVDDFKEILTRSDDGRPWLAAIDAHRDDRGDGGDDARRDASFLDDLVKKAMRPVRRDLPIFEVLKDKAATVTLPQAPAAPGSSRAPDAGARITSESDAAAQAVAAAGAGAEGRIEAGGETDRP